MSSIDPNQTIEDLEGGDIIGHLISVEHEAAGLLADARDEADKRVSAARAEADAEFKRHYEAIVREFESEYETRTAEIERRRQAEFAAYCEHVEGVQMDVSAFEHTLESILFDAGR